MPYISITISTGLLCFCIYLSSYICRICISLYIVHITRYPLSPGSESALYNIGYVTVTLDCIPPSHRATFTLIPCTYNRLTLWVPIKSDAGVNASSHCKRTKTSR